MIPGLYDYHSSLIQRHPDAAFREVGGEMFLVHPDGERIFNLNPMAAALWRLMAEPTTGADMTEIVLAAFPIMAPAKIEHDVKELIGALLSQGFVRVRGQA